MQIPGFSTPGLSLDQDQATGMKRMVVYAADDYRELAAAQTAALTQCALLLTGVCMLLVRSLQVAPGLFRR